MMAFISTVSALSRRFILGTFLIALLALSAQEVRSQDCVPGWGTFPVFQTNPVYAVCEYDGIVYRGGWFSLFRWVGDDWEILDIGGDIGNLFVADFTTWGDLLIIGGYFPQAGGMTVNSIATWDGVEFGGVGGGVDGEIRALAVYEGDLIAGGGFDFAGGTPANNIARWDGSAWYPLGSGVSGPAAFVQNMVVWQGDLYVVGDFTHAGDSEVSYIARWDGSTWSGVGGGVSVIGGGPTGLRDIEVHGGDLVIVGAFDFAGGVEAINIARWDGVNWFPLGSGSDPYGYMGLRQAALSVASYKGLLYVGADFSEAVDDDAAKAFAVWDGVSWAPVDQGIEGGGWPFGPSVRDLEAVGQGVTRSLLIGGDFSEADGLETDNVARYTYCDEVTGVAAEESFTGPLQLYLSSNPTAASFQYTIRLGRESKVNGALFDVRGRRIGTLLNQPLPIGTHRFQLDFNELGVRTSGIYFLRVEADGSAVSRKLIFIK